MLPIIGALLKAGLPLLANAALAKGTEYLEERTGIKLDPQSEPDSTQMAALRTIEAEQRPELERLKLENNRLDAEIDRAYLADTQDARARDTKLIEAGYRNTRANTMLAGAGGVVIGILFVAVWMSPLDEYVKGILTLVLGRALGYIDQGFNFEFGTTRNSSKKDDTISALTAKG